eukprot:6213832-Pleurochrysis_carterae.AAC.1
MLSLSPDKQRYETLGCCALHRRVALDLAKGVAEVDLHHNVPGALLQQAADAMHQNGEARLYADCNLLRREVQQ